MYDYMHADSSIVLDFEIVVADSARFLVLELLERKNVSAICVCYPKQLKDQRKSFVADSTTMLFQLILFSHNPSTVHKMHSLVL